MRKRICVEIDGVFYESLNCAEKVIEVTHQVIKLRCLSDKFPNYKIVPFRTNYTEKRCNECKKVKPLSEFRICLKCQDGHRSDCKLCEKIYNKKYRTNNSEKEKARHKVWYEDNPEYRKNLRKNNSFSHKERDKAWREDPIHRLHTNMSRAINRSLKKMKNGARWEKLVGYPCSELITHLENKFTEGMNWENYGHGKDKWNIDHVIAKCYFNITSNTCQEFIDCWSLDNLQPLWATRNYEKGTKPMESKYLIKPF